MIGRIKKYIPKQVINFGYHLPKAVLTSLIYGFPGRKLEVIGVTGTDGKTTTVNMIYQILKASGEDVSMISTIAAVIGKKTYDTGFHVTSPDPMDVQKYLKNALLAGSKKIVLEVTSHALAQYRVWGVRFKVGVITNVTHEHLDYHGSFENYLNTKAKLIEGVEVAVLNYDDPSFKKLAQKTSGKIVTFGLSNKAYFNPVNFHLKLKIPGEYNIYNAMAAAAVTWALGVDKKVIKRTLENFTGLTGRMEKIKNDLGINLVVDFAHTPNALEAALKALRKESEGRLIAVYGCAGTRDVGKRPMMGKVSAQLADITILTDEDPRFEDRNKIIEEIKVGAFKAGAKFGENLFQEPDRDKAILKALKMAKKGDTVGIFGKGHEQSMNYQGTERPWSDQKAAKEALQVLKHSV